MLWVGARGEEGKVGEDETGGLMKKVTSQAAGNGSKPRYDLNKERANVRLVVKVGVGREA